MKRNLLSNINLESDADVMGGIDGSLENTQEAVIEAIVVAQDGDEIVRDQMALESAFISLSNVIGSAQNLEDAGVDQELINDTLVPDAIDAVASVDEGMAEETESEAVVAMEADDKKGVWATIKEKLVAMWEALKKNISRFWEWIKSFFTKSKTTAQKGMATIKELQGKIAALGDGAIEVPAKAIYCIDDKPLDVNSFSASVAKIKQHTKDTREKVFSELTEAWEIYIKDQAETAKKMKASEDDLPIEELKQGSEEVKKQLDEALAALSKKSIVNAMIANGTQTFIGYSVKNDDLVPATLTGEAVVKFANKSELTKYAEGLKTLAFLSNLDDRNIKRMEAVTTKFISSVEATLKLADLSPERATIIRSVVAHGTQVQTKSMRLIKDLFPTEAVTAIGNGISLLNAAITVGSAKKAA